MSKPVIVVITGGDTSERSGSLKSARYLFEVMRERYQVALVEFVQGSWAILDAQLGSISFDELEFDDVPPTLRRRQSGVSIRPDAVMITIHGRPGETGELQGYLDILGIPHSGSGVLASSLAADKFRCKAFLAGALGMSGPRQWRFDGASVSASGLVKAGVRPPFVIKPNGLGSGIGVYSVHAADYIETAVQWAARESVELLVEEYVDGVELTVGAMRLASHQHIFEIAEVVRPRNEAPIRRYATRKEASIVIPARIAPSVVTELRSLILDIGEAMGLRGCYRADFILCGDQLFFLEVNSVPGTARDSVLIQQAAAAGVSADRLFEMLAGDLLSSNWKATSA